MRDLPHHDATTIDHPRAAADPRRIHDMMINEAHASISLLRRLGSNQRRLIKGVGVDTSTADDDEGDDDDDDDDDDPRPTTVYLRAGGAAPPDGDDDDDREEGWGGTAGVGAAVRLVPIPAGRRPRRTTEDDGKSSANPDLDGYDEDATEALYLDPLLLRALLVLSPPPPSSPPRPPRRRGRSLPVRLLPRSSSRSRGGRGSTPAGTAAGWGWLELAYVDDDDDGDDDDDLSPPGHDDDDEGVGSATATTTVRLTYACSNTRVGRSAFGGGGGGGCGGDDDDAWCGEGEGRRRGTLGMLAEALDGAVVVEGGLIGVVLGRARGEGGEDDDGGLSSFGTVDDRDYYDDEDGGRDRRHVAFFVVSEMTVVAPGDDDDAGGGGSSSAGGGGGEEGGGGGGGGGGGEKRKGAAGRRRSLRRLSTRCGPIEVTLDRRRRPRRPPPDDDDAVDADVDGSHRRGGGGGTGRDDYHDDPAEERERRHRACPGYESVLGELTALARTMCNPRAAPTATLLSGCAGVGKSRMVRRLLLLCVLAPYLSSCFYVRRTSHAGVRGRCFSLLCRLKGKETDVLNDDFSPPSVCHVKGVVVRARVIARRFATFVFHDVPLRLRQGRAPRRGVVLAVRSSRCFRCGGRRSWEWRRRRTAADNR